MSTIAQERLSVVEPASQRRAGSGLSGRGLLLGSGAAVLAAGGLLVAAASVGGAAAPAVIADPGAVTRWGLLLSRVGQDVAAMCTIGVLAVVVLLLPTRAGALVPDAVRLVRLASRWAAAWAFAAGLGVMFGLSEVTAKPLPEILRLDVLALGLELPQTRALLSTVWLAGLVAIWARRTQSPAGGWVLMGTAVAGLLPPLINGHAAHETTQVLSLAVHMGTASLWVGGLVALALHLRSSTVALTSALPRYSRLALACFVAVAMSGAVSGWSAMGKASDLWTTPYGQLLLAKVAALGLLGGLGHWHRRRTVPAVAAGRPRAFLALATAELVLMAGVAGLAVGLARTAPPPQADHGVMATSTAAR